MYLLFILLAQSMRIKGWREPIGSLLQKARIQIANMSVWRRLSGDLHWPNWRWSYKGSSREQDALRRDHGRD
jgi:hypothetical protein